MYIYFVFIAEGSSDEGLIPHLEQLLLEASASEVTGIYIDPQRLPPGTGRTVEEKLRAAIRLEPNAHLFIIHRDADSRDPEPRYQEISGAARSCNLTKNWVAVVPIQETEAWVLLDEQAIRAVVGRPSGRSNLGLPKPHTVEQIASPKEKLQEVLVIASEAKGRQLQRLRLKFSSYHRRLLEQLASEGPLQQVPSWRRMRDDLIAALRALQEQQNAD